MISKAIAHANIALVKYWGKRDAALNLPDVGSISITLERLSTVTEVFFSKALTQDKLIMNNKEAGKKEVERISKFLNLLRKAASIPLFAKVVSENNFPTSAGLASSASAFAALSLAAADAAGLSYDKRNLSILARRGSGSAARSVYGGFVVMNRGEKEDGSDAYAEQIADQHYWDIRVLIVVTSTEAKKIGSTDGMILSKTTSPYYKSWVESSVIDLREMRAAIAVKDFEKVAEISEHSCLKMHALAMSCNPGLIYWNPTTVKLVHEVKSLRAQGLPVFFSIDAGPQVKIFTMPDYVEKIKNHIEGITGIKKIISTKIGGDAHIIKVGS